MKTQNVRSIAYAVLNSAMFAPIGGDGWCQLMPAGRVKARDGRPEKPAEGWLIDKSTCERLVSRLVALNQPIKVDYNHQTLYKGKPPPLLDTFTPAPTISPGETAINPAFTFDLIGIRRQCGAWKTKNMPGCRQLWAMTR